MEVELRVTKLLFSGRANVSGTAAQLKTIFSGLSAIQSQIKTIVLTNTSDETIYFGADNSVLTTSGGGVIYSGATRELPLYDLNYSPWFIADTNRELAIEVWA